MPVTAASATRRLGGNAALYALVFALQRAVGLVMLPFYTRYLSPADYGVLQLLEMTTDIAAILFTAGLSGGVQRLYFMAADDKARRRVLSTSLLVEAALGMVGTLTLFVFAPFIHSAVFRGAGSPDLIRIAACNFTLSILLAVPVLLLQAQHRAKTYAILITAKLAVQVSLNLFFIAGLGLGVRGILLSSMVASGLFGLGLATWLLKQTGLRIDGGIFKQLLRFGLPAQVATAGSFILGFGDRFFLQASHGESAVGLYGLAYQFGFLLISLSVQPALQAWNPYRFQIATEPRETRDRDYARGFFYLNLIFVTVATGIVLFIRPGLSILTSPDFHAAYRLVPVIVVGYLFHGWTLTTGFSIDYSGRTEYHAISAWIATVCIIAAYALLIPPFGPMGAGVATMIGLAIRLGAVLFFGRRLWPIQYGWARSLRILIPATVTAAIALAWQDGNLWADIARGMMMLTIYGVAVWLGVLGSRERELMRSFARSPAAISTKLFRS